ncbi:hypothetical protein AYO45_00145 [Gammaproteobacteria bacterium SCGC AG-212-F23]|nr:hypothetical protein AYO45_00145 [Gammaproteobacteria bacterium SCGC AG-212-F23]
MKSARHLTLELKPSKIAIFLISIVIVSSMLISFLLLVSWVEKLILLLFISGYGSQIMRKYGLLTARNAIFHCRYSDENGWYFSSHDVDFFAVDIMGESTLTRWLSVLRFQIAGEKSKQACVIFKDSIATNDYRKMLAILRNY